MHRIARTVARVTLRARLTALSVLLVLFGLAAAGIATHYALRSFLVDRIDQEFGPAEAAALHYATDTDNDSPTRQALDNVLPLDGYAVAVLPNGRLLRPYFHGHTKVSEDLVEVAVHAPVGISSDDGYRVRVVPASVVERELQPPGGPGNGGQQQDQPFPIPRGTRLVIAISTKDVNSTLDRLDRLEMVIGLIVVAIAGGLAWALVRVELRPLVRIEDTAAAIAAGDLSRRVDVAAPGTEVGSLGESLNAMLAQIEAAFDERRASENRLRRFVADAGHELRTPLTSVRGYAELFRRGGAAHPDDVGMMMARIESEAQRMGVLVEDLLLLAKLDQGRPLAHQQVHLSELVAEMAGDQNMLQPDWPLELRIDPGVEVVGDEQRLRQAVGNLLANTRAHTPRGTRTTVAVAMRAGMAMVEVADDGPGIPDEIMGRVFERFFRADPSRSRASGGSGLGLSIVSAIAEAHGGRVEAESPQGGGAVFRILLPPEAPVAGS
ncbi:MAG TPA: ATP-binding protein [Gaiellales bacterium]|jgi:two-component system OmpR family sensor kinase